MLFVQKLPALEPQIRDALKCHIMRKRQRLKQELEQDAIEKRLKREKELKQSQNEMTLDQIKDHLDKLEKKLESLKEEKHHLFVKLKQLLNEDSSKRKQNESLDSRPSEKSLDFHRNATTSKTLSYPVAKTGEPIPSHRELNHEPNHLQKQQITSHIGVIKTNPIKKHTSPQVPPQLYPGNMNPYVLTLPMLPPMYPPQVTPSAIRHSQPLNHGRRSINDSMSYEVPDYLGQSPLFEPNAYLSHNMAQQRSIRWPESTIEPALHFKNKPQDQQSYQHGSSKRSHAIAGFNDHPFDDRSYPRKKSTNSTYPNENQFFSKTGSPLGYGLSSSASESLNLRQVPIAPPPHSQTTLGLPIPACPMPAFLPNQSIDERRNLPYHLGQNYEYLMKQHGKPGLLIAGLNSYFQPQQAGVSSPNLVAHSKAHSPLPNPLGQYFGVENNLTHVGYPQLASQYENASSIHNDSNRHMSQSLHNSRYVSQSISRKVTLPKNHHNNSK